MFLCLLYCGPSISVAYCVTWAESDIIIYLKTHHSECLFRVPGANRVERGVAGRLDRTWRASIPRLWPAFSAQKPVLRLEGSSPTPLSLLNGGTSEGKKSKWRLHIYCCRCPESSCFSRTQQYLLVNASETAHRTLCAPP
jgi:hypothetical protein